MLQILGAKFFSWDFEKLVPILYIAAETRLYSNYIKAFNRSVVVIRCNYFVIVYALIFLLECNFSKCRCLGENCKQLNCCFSVSLNWI